VKNGGRRFAVAAAVRRSGIIVPATTGLVFSETMTCSGFADAGGKREPLRIKSRSRSAFRVMFGVQLAPFIGFQNLGVSHLFSDRLAPSVLVGKVIEPAFRV
jgi:hypothetical protein